MRSGTVRKGLVRTGLAVPILVSLLIAPLAGADVCDDEPNNLQGLCNSYCVQMDCAGDPNASPIACQQVLENYRKKSGGLDPPCLEVCDGVDNDGDGDVDEGFDLDNDGVARCCTEAPFFATLDATRQNIRSHVLSDTAPVTFTPGLTFVAESATEPVRLSGVADFTGDGTRDVLWSGVNTKNRFLTECRGGEWQTRFTGTWQYTYNGGADLDGDSLPDVVGWDMQCCFMSGPVLGPGPDLGLTALGDGTGNFAEVYGTFVPNAVLGAWQARRVYNLEDATGDGDADLIFLEYASGAASTSILYLAAGDGLGGFASPVLVGTAPNQPQNFGDMGDVDCDGRTDWVGGPDDDGDKGLVLAMYGNGFGGFSPPTPLVDTCVGCPGSGTAHGRGQAQLFDWNGDNCLDLLTSHANFTGISATILYWQNNGSGGFPTPVTVLGPGNLTGTAFWTPLRN